MKKREEVAVLCLEASSFTVSGRKTWSSEYRSLGKKNDCKYFLAWTGFEFADDHQ